MGVEGGGDKKLKKKIKDPFWNLENAEKWKLKLSDVWWFNPAQNLSKSFRTVL